MPTYSYFCDSCKKSFELFSTIANYTTNPECVHCESVDTSRDYDTDLKSICPSVKKSDGELKTLGDLAKRNADRMSDDQKISLYQKHNSYKEEKLETKPLPSGMSYKKKPPKPLWPGNNTKKKRRDTK